MVVRESIKRDLARLLVWYPVRWIIWILPVSLGFKLFGIMGSIHYRISSRMKNHLLKNYKLGLAGLVPDSSPWNEWIRKYIQLHYVGQLSIFLFPSLNKNNLNKYHSFKGLEHLDLVQKQEKGVILLHAHFGPAHLPLHALGLQGYPMMQIGLPTDEGLSWIGKNVAFRLRLKYESKIAATIIPANTFLRPVMEGLKETHKVVMTTGDGAGNGQYIGEFVPLDLLGKKLLVATGPVDLARRTKAIILPMFTIQTAIHQYQSIIHPPLSMEDSLSEKDIMQEWTRIFESYLLNQPFLWHFWDEFEQRLNDAKNF